MDNFVNQMAGIATVGVAAGVTLKVTDAALGTTKKGSRTTKKHQETLARVRAHDAKMRKAVFGK